MKILIISLFFSSYAMASSNNLEVQGHRGARAVLPENTLAAMAYALRLGVDTLELDVVATKDNVLVLSHDPVLNPVICRGEKGSKITKQIPIRSLTLKELRKYNCASVKNPRFPKQVPDASQKIATLKEVFQLVKYTKMKVPKKVMFNIETKMVPGYPEISPSPKVFAKMIIDLAREFEFLDRLVIQSFDHRSLKAVKEIEPKVKVAALTGENNPINLVEVMKAIPADIWSPNQHWVTKNLVKEMHKNKIQVIPWTANTKEEWQRLISMGVDGIISDDPKELLKFLKR